MSEIEYNDSSKDYPDDVYTSLFLFEDLQESSPEMMAWSNVKMKQDFGPLKKDQEIAYISFEPEQVKCDIYDENNELVNTFKYKLVAV
jgi:hypothetical protein